MCRKCKKIFEQDAPMFGCRICGYDVCAKCYEQQTVKRIIQPKKNQQDQYEEVMKKNFTPALKYEKVKSVEEQFDEDMKRAMELSNDTFNHEFRRMRNYKWPLQCQPKNQI